MILTSGICQEAVEEAKGRLVAQDIPDVCYKFACVEKGGEKGDKERALSIYETLQIAQNGSIKEGNKGR